MTDARNDVVARLIAPALVGPMSPETAAELVRQVEAVAAARALKHVVRRASDTGQVTLRELEILLGEDAVAPYRRTKHIPDDGPLPEAVALVEAALKPEGEGA